MIFRDLLPAVALAALLGLGTAVPADAHGGGMAQPYHYGWHHGWHMAPNSMAPNSMDPGMMGPNGMMPGMMMQGCPMGGPGMMPQGMMGPGMMGPDMMGQGMMMSPHRRPPMVGPRGMGSGSDDAPMMGPGAGQGMGGQGGGMMMQPGAESVSVEDVSRLLQRRLDWQGNPHVKLGKVEEKDGDTILAEIVTQDGSLVERLEVDRRSGWMRMVP